MPICAQVCSLSARDGKQSIPAAVDPALTESKLELTSVVKKKKENSKQKIRW